MLENQIEAGLMLTRLRCSIDDIGLADEEAEKLLGLAPGEWAAYAGGRTAAAMTELQETRARLSSELVHLMSNILGGREYVGPWLRDAGNLPISPLAWVSADLQRLLALIEVVREQAG